jgi:L-alanine-DL-glutamate epimerase-like enolase superfamily enzyme
MPRVDSQWRTASYAANVVNALILEVQADGLSGIGSAVARPNGTPVEDFERDCDGPVRELLVGRDPFERTSLYEALQRSPINHAVLSAVDVALHDLAGKATKLPCYALWGGAVRSEVQVVRMVGIKPPGQLVDAVADFMTQGFTHFKVKLGTGVAEDEERIAALRSEFGDRIWLGIDGNGAYEVDDAIELSRALQPYDVRLIEQPIDYHDLDGLARLTAASPIPIMADQLVNGLKAALDVCQRRAAHVVSLKIGQAGSIDNCRHIAAVCLESGVRVHIGGGARPAVMDAAHAHLAVSVPGIDPECEVGECLAIASDPTFGLPIQAGRCIPTSAPGFGLSVSS